MEGQIFVRFVVQTAPFDIHKGGKQGGVETPDQWKITVEFILGPVIQAWTNMGLGFALTTEDGTLEALISHAIWCDNVVLFATSIGVMQKMVSDLDLAFGRIRDIGSKRYFEWKPSSLEYLVTDACADPDGRGLYIQRNGQGMEYQKKEHIKLLGDRLDKRGATATSIQYNLGRGEATYFKYQGVLKNPSLPISKRLQGWRASPGTAAIYNSSTWHITATHL